MEIKARMTHMYMSVIVQVDSTVIDLGLLNNDERMELAGKLFSAADEIADGTGIQCEYLNEVRVDALRGAMDELKDLELFQAAEVLENRAQEIESGQHNP